MIIRPYQTSDREQVRNISLATAMTGRPSTLFFDGEDVLADALTLYYTDYEPGSSFVAEQAGRVVGYVIAAKDTRVMDRVFGGRIVWNILGKALVQGLFFSRKNMRLMGRSLMCAFKGGFVMPDFYAEYPATLHINILDGHRASGLGRRLMDAGLRYLEASGVRGVRLATMSEGAGEFFAKNGLTLLHRSTRPYFRDILGQDVPLLVYGKRFTERRD